MDWGTNDHFKSWNFFGIENRIVTLPVSLLWYVTSKLYVVGIMTAKLLPAFLKCFTDNYVSVRMEVCHACNILRIKDPQVLDKLVFMATYDAIWRVKALAFQGKNWNSQESPQPVGTPVLVGGHPSPALVGGVPQSWSGVPPSQNWVTPPLWLGPGYHPRKDLGKNLGLG